MAERTKYRDKRLKHKAAAPRRKPDHPRFWLARVEDPQKLLRIWGIKGKEADDLLKKSRSERQRLIKDREIRANDFRPMPEKHPGEKGDDGLGGNDGKGGKNDGKGNDRTGGRAPDETGSSGPRRVRAHTRVQAGKTVQVQEFQRNPLKARMKFPRFGKTKLSRVEELEEKLKRHVEG